MGKKYIIKLDDNNLAYTAIMIDGVPYIKPLQLLPYTEPDLDTVRKEAYEEGYKTAKIQCGIQAEKDMREVGERHYQRGLSDAWEAARKILFNPDDGGMSAIDVNEVFGENSWTVMKDFSVAEVVAKIKEFEDSKQKIKVGDEVEDGVANLVVLEINEDGTVEGFTNYGSVVHAIPRKKTGRYFPEVVALLKNMKGK